MESDMSEHNDYAELIEHIQEAEGAERKKAFNALVDQFYFAAYAWAIEKLGDRQTAQDAVQEAFWVAFEKIDDLRDAKAFPGWFRRIVQTQANRQVRGQRELVTLDDELVPGTPEPAREVEQRLLHIRLREAIHDLPVHERIVTRLYYLDGYSQQEVAELLELPLTTVKKRLQRARENLREILLPLARLRAA